jgi:hypothetical protein
MFDSLEISWSMAGCRRVSQKASSGQQSAKDKENDCILDKLYKILAKLSRTGGTDVTETGEGQGVWVISKGNG